MAFDVVCDDDDDDSVGGGGDDGDYDVDVVGYGVGDDVVDDGVCDDYGAMMLSIMMFTLMKRSG